MTTEIAPAISVVIPVYNREDTIAGCLDSIARQTLPATEVILVDDGSTDSTAAVLKAWISQQSGPTRYRYLRQENQGKSAALNTGFEACESDWIAFNDSDDYWVPEKLQKQFRLLAKFPDCQVCVSDSCFINDASLTQTNFQIRGFTALLKEDGPLPDTYRHLADNPNGIFMQSLVARRSCAATVFPLAPDLRVGQDIDLIFRLSLTSDFCFSREALVEIDRTPSRNIGLTKQHDMKSLFRLQTKERIFQGWLANPSEKIVSVRPALKHNLSVVQRRIGSLLKAQGDSRQAKRYFGLAFENSRSLANFARWLLNSVAV